MSKLLNQMVQDAEANEREAAKANPTDELMTLASEFEILRDDKDELEARLKVVNERYYALMRTELPNAMEAAGLVSDAGKGSFTTKFGSRIHLQGELFVGCNKEHQAKLFAWLRKIGQGEVIKEQVHPGTLKSLVKELREEKTTIPEFVSVTDGHKAVLTRAKAKK